MYLVGAIDGPTAGVIISAVVGAVAIILAAIIQLQPFKKKSNGDNKPVADEIEKRRREFDRVILSMERYEEDRQEMRGWIKEIDQELAETKKDTNTLLRKLEEKVDSKHQDMMTVLQGLVNAIKKS